MEKEQISDRLYSLLDAHLESVGFLWGALANCMEKHVSDEEKQRIIAEIEIIENRNIQIRKIIGWK
jgi:hypothetical protein